jgi:carbon monoxide dehydrogenase subunit G
MEFSGRYVIPSPPQVVWESLNDAETLRACIPGCEKLERTDATHLTATATLKIGPVKATFRANIEQSELDPPHRCVLKGEGQGGVAGFARGEATVLLTPEGPGTVLSYTAKASIGGKLAQVGQRLIDGAAKQIADDFFSRFANLVAGKTAAAASPAELPAPAPEIASVEDKVPVHLAAQSKREGLGPAIWVVGLLGVIVILLIIFVMLLARA